MASGWVWPIIRCWVRRCSWPAARGGCSPADSRSTRIRGSPITRCWTRCCCLGQRFWSWRWRPAGRLVARAWRSLMLQAPLVLTQGTAVQLQVAVGEPDEDGRRAGECLLARRSRRPRTAQEDGSGGWTRHASGTLADVEAVARTGGADAQSLGSEWPPAGCEELDVEFLYDRLAEAGLQLWPGVPGRACGVAQGRGDLRGGGPRRRGCRRGRRVRHSPRAHGRGAAHRPAGVG